jgi:hypothetical protein
MNKDQAKMACEIKILVDAQSEEGLDCNRFSHAVKKSLKESGNEINITKL